MCTALESHLTLYLFLNKKVLAERHERFIPHQGVKWEDIPKKEEKEDILTEKEDKKRTFFSLELIHWKQKSIKLVVEPAQEEWP